jgi:GTPase SAR1 family protein
MLPINTSTVLLDSSSAREDEGAMVDAEIDKAHVIILVYDVNNVECIRRLKTNWLPRIAKVNDRVRLSEKFIMHLDSSDSRRKQGRLEV